MQVLVPTGDPSAWGTLEDEGLDGTVARAHVAGGFIYAGNTPVADYDVFVISDLPNGQPDGEGATQWIERRLQTGGRAIVFADRREIKALYLPGVRSVLEGSVIYCAA